MSSPGVESFGYLASVLSVIQFVPQVRRTLRTRITAGISAPFWGVAGAQASMWIVYGVGRGLVPSVLTNIVLTVCTVLMLGVLVREGAPQARGSAVFAAITWLVVSGVTLAAGYQPAGVGATFVSFVIMWPQTWTAMRSRSIEGLAPVAWMIGVAATASWFCYGIGRGDIRIWLTAGESCLLSIVVLARVLHVRRMHARGEHGPAAAGLAGAVRSNEDTGPVAVVCS